MGASSVRQWPARLRLVAAWSSRRMAIVSLGFLGALGPVNDPFRRSTGLTWEQRPGS